MNLSETNCSLNYIFFNVTNYFFQISPIMFTDDSGNQYVKDAETDQYIPVSVIEQNNQSIIQFDESFMFQQKQ